MNRKLKSILIPAVITLTACSTTPNADNYTKVMNQPVVSNGAQVEAQTTQLNKAAWRELKIAQAVSTRINKATGEPIPSQTSGEGYLYVRASIVNEGDSPVQANWRCKFYNSSGIPFGDDENDLTATSKTGLGWHTMIAYPVKASSQTDDANIVRCIAPSKLATQFKIEVHDTSNDVTIYK